MAANSLASKSVGPPDNSYIWYLQSGGTASTNTGMAALTLGFQVALGDGAETPLYLDSAGIGVRNPAGAVSKIASLATTNRAVKLADSPGTLFPAATAILAADQSNSTVTPAAVPGFQVDLEASGLYEFELMLLFKSAAATTGARFRINGPVDQTTWVTYLAIAPLSTNAITNLGSQQSQEFYAWAQDFLAGANVPAADTVYVSRVRGMCRISSTAPTLPVSLHIWSEVAASNITLMAGSQIRFHKIN